MANAKANGGVIWMRNGKHNSSPQEHIYEEELIEEATTKEFLVV